MRYVFFLWAICLPIFLSAQARPYIYGEEVVLSVQKVAPSVAQKPAATPKTVMVEASDPFYDDFSRSGLEIDSNLWFIDGSLRAPLQYRRGTINNPTLGVANFDGLNSHAQPYSYMYSADFTDRLESHYLDITSLSPSDGVMLSFYLEAKGKASSPTQIDTFFVKFKDNAGNWQTMFAEAGGLGYQPFRKFFIPLVNPDFFHPEFQIRFERYGIACNHVGVWNLDYVFLGANRSVSDSSHNEVSIVNTDKSLLHPYTSISYQQFQGKNLVQTPNLQLSNLKNSLVNLDLEMKITDPVGGTVFTSGNQTTTNLSLNPMDFYAQPLTGFDDQTLIPFSSSYLLTAQLPTDIDATGANNRYEELYHVDSLIGYDDGEADMSYGITGPRGFGQKFEISSPDYVEAIWIAFAPTLYYNTITQQSTYLDQLSFKPTIWTTHHPDSILVQQSNGKVEYSDTLNTFVRYSLFEPVWVTGDIWVGLEQTDNKPIGVGLDKDYDNRSWFGWDSAGTWATSQISGTLMIRLELQNHNFNPVGISPTIAPATFQSFPNPVTEGNLHLIFPSQATNYQVTVSDLQGKEILQQTISPTNSTIKLPNLSSGIYFLRHQAVTQTGSLLQMVEKIWIK